MSLRSPVLFLIFSVLLLLPGTSAAKIPIISDAKRTFDRAAADTVASMSDEVRADAEELIDFLFSKHVNPTLREIEAMVSSGISETDNRVKARLEQVDEIVTRTLKSVSEQVQELDVIRERAIKDLRELQRDTIENAYCAGTGLRQRAVDDLAGLIESLKPNLFEVFTEEGRRNRRCRSELGLPSSTSSWRQASLFDFRKCVILDELDETTPAVTIASAYLDLLGLAITTQCALRDGLGTSQTKFSSQVVELRGRHVTWQWALEVPDP